MDIVAVWLPVCVSIKGLIPGIILSGLKNWLKIGFVAGNLTGLWCNKTGKQGCQ